MKRIQECNRIEKAWRYRWYGLLPFIWVACLFRAFRYQKKSDLVEGFWNLHDLYFSVRLGEIQIKRMNWYYTSEEVFGEWEDMKEKLNNMKEEHSGFV